MTWLTAHPRKWAPFCTEAVLCLTIFGNIGQMETCNDNCFHRLVVILFGCLVLWHATQSYAQTPTQLPDGKIVGKYFWFIPGGFVASQSPGAVVRGATPSEVFAKFVQSLVPVRGMTFTNRGCTFIPTPYNTVHPEHIPWFKSQVGDDVTGPIFATYLARGFPWPELIADTYYGEWRCTVDARWPDGAITQNAFDLYLQLTCPFGFGNAHGNGEIQGACERIPNSGAVVNVDKNVGCPVGDRGGVTLGNPINPGSGVACKIEVDFDYEGTLSGLSPFQRHYSNLATSAGASTLGRSWRHSYVSASKLFDGLICTLGDGCRGMV